MLTKKFYLIKKFVRYFIYFSILSSKNLFKQMENDSNLKEKFKKNDFKNKNHIISSRKNLKYEDNQGNSLTC